MRVPTSVWLFLVLTVLTCIVAYWADNLGKNLGKKRISLLGLRPRQTATLISMASSVAIMLVTLLTLTFFSQDFKNAVFRADRLNDNNQKLRKENRTLEDQRERSRDEVESLKNAARQSKNEARKAGEDEKVAQENLRKIRLNLNEANKKVEDANGKLSTAKTSLETAQKKANAAAQRANAAQQRFQSAQQRFQQAEQKASEAEAKATRAETQARSASTQKSAAFAAANAARATANAARAAANQARAAAGKAQAASSKANQELRRAQDNLQTAQENLQSTQENLRTVRESTKGVMAANKEAAKLQAQLEKQNRELLLNNEDLRIRSGQIINAFATGDISISVGQVFAERIIQPDETASAIQAQLNALQNDALLELKKPPINATNVQLLTLTLPADNGNQSSSFDAEKLQRILIENLLSAEVPVAVRWVAARNHANGEKVIEGRLVTIEVRAAVPEGTILAQDTIAAGQSDAAVFSRLLALTDKARGAARALGVIPPLSPQQPNFFAAGTNEHVFTALREIQSRGGAARVSLVADAPLSSVAPPQMRFVIEAPETEGASTRAPDAGVTTAPSS